MQFEKGKCKLKPKLQTSRKVLSRNCKPGIGNVLRRNDFGFCWFGAHASQLLIRNPNVDEPKDERD